MAVTVLWNNGAESKTLEEGSYTAQNGDFPNDVIEEVRVPFGYTAVILKDYGDEGSRRVLQGSSLPGQDAVYKMADEGLAGAVSNVKVEAALGL